MTSPLSYSLLKIPTTYPFLFITFYRVQKEAILSLPAGFHLEQRGVSLMWLCRGEARGLQGARGLYVLHGEPLSRLDTISNNDMDVSHSWNKRAMEGTSSWGHAIWRCRTKTECGLSHDDQLRVFVICWSTSLGRLRESILGDQLVELVCQIVAWSAESVTMQSRQIHVEKKSFGW